MRDTIDDLLDVESETETLPENTFADNLRFVLDELSNGMSVEPDDLREDIRSIDTFEEVGMLTYNAGLVVTCADGTEYQLTIVRSR